LPKYALGTAPQRERAGKYTDAGFALIIDGEACFYGLPLQGAQGDEALERFGKLGVRQVAANRVKMGQSVNEAASMSVFQVADESTGEKLT
jgi:hypothetical protein